MVFLSFNPALSNRVRESFAIDKKRMSPLRTCHSSRFTRQSVLEAAVQVRTNRWKVLFGRSRVHDDNSVTGPNRAEVDEHWNCR